MNLKKIVCAILGHKKKRVYDGITRALKRDDMRGWFLSNELAKMLNEIASTYKDAEWDFENLQAIIVCERCGQVFEIVHLAPIKIKWHIGDIKVTVGND